MPACAHNTNEHHTYTRTPHLRFLSVRRCTDHRLAFTYTTILSSHSHRRIREVPSRGRHLQSLRLVILFHAVIARGDQLYFAERRNHVTVGTTTRDCVAAFYNECVKYCRYRHREINESFVLLRRRNIPDQ